MSKTPIISFEFFPPKTPEGMKSLEQNAILLAKVQPDFFSVTFGAGGSTREGTIETVKRLQSIGISVAPHLACMGLSRHELGDILKKYQDQKITRIVALRGDMPSGDCGASDLSFANELVAFIREKTGKAFHIEVAAYPEVHPQAISAQDDLLSLKKKMEAGANSAITQYFFNVDAYYYFLDECQKEGITIPIVPGIMPITNFEKLARFSERCGAEIPRWIQKRLESLKNDPEGAEAFGLEVVYKLCDDLLQFGVPGLHFYTLNHAKASLKIIHLLGLQSKKRAII